MTRAPGGTKFPSIVLLLIPASHPKAKAECVKPEMVTLKLMNKQDDAFPSQ